MGKAGILLSSPGHGSARSAILTSASKKRRQRAAQAFGSCERLSTWAPGGTGVILDCVLHNFCLLPLCLIVEVGEWPRGLSSPWGTAMLWAYTLVTMQLALISILREHIATALHWRFAPRVASSPWSACITQSYNQNKIIKLFLFTLSDRFLPRFRVIKKKLWPMSSCRSIYNDSAHDALQILNSAERSFLLR